MGNADFDHQYSHHHQRVEIPPPKPFLKTLMSNVKETLFPDDPFRKFKNQPLSKKISLGLQYFVPILDWAPRYNFQFFKADVIAGITIASLAIPQGISYAGLANLPPVIGLYSSFVPPMIYAMLGSSKHLAIGNVAVPSLLISAMLGKFVNPHENPNLYLQLVFTATFFAGVFQASLGFLRLGFIVDFLSHATILGFMGGAATVVCLQQLKGILGLVQFTHQTDILSVMRSIFSQMHQWRWESGVLGCCFLFFLLLTRYFSKKKPTFFWISAMAPLTSIGYLKKGINPPSYSQLAFSSQYLTIAIKTGVVTSVIALAEGIAVGRSFAILENYDIDGNKEMIAFGLMNIAGSCTSCYLTTGPFSRTAVNFNAGCKTVVSNIVMATAVMITLLFLTPLFHYTPLVVLSSIIIAAMLGIIDYNAAIRLWKVDKYDFLVCVSSYIGVVFGSVEVGLIVAVAMSLLRVLLFVARPKTFVLGKIPNSMTYRSIEQYSVASSVPGVLIIHIDAPIYFANASYLRERISRWIDEEEEKQRTSTEIELQYVILDMSAVGNIDTSGISMLEEVKRIADRRCLKVLLANPGGEVMKKLDKSNFIDTIGKEWIYLTVGEAVNACNYILQTCKFQSKRIDSSATPDDNV
ncbi:Sulfate transporter 3.1 [Datura stramonium]|uniref:Sulfate transporter 3.1 n=1 Tax=Datura stramonium TaxID=4076 RepID=A0ABS8W473_DATST|nr:Sulfate transporter 3.1 [Datura stramonium]